MPPPSTDAPIGDKQINDDDNQKYERKHWWEVVREAREMGELLGFKTKGRARQNAARSVSFDWSFTPSLETAATRSPQFDWIGMKWNVRFQKSPFDSGIMHPPAWSIFFDLIPPYKGVFRITGLVVLKDQNNRFNLWKFDKEIQPAWDGQELYTLCRKRLDLDKYVQASITEQKPICICVKLSTVGLGQVYAMRPPASQVETLPFNLKVGTTTVARRFSWDIKKHLNNFSDEQLSFWRSLKSGSKGSRKVNFGPRDLVAALKQVHITGICTWKGCVELKKFVINAVHDAKNGFAVMPYHLVFLDFDLMDGSGSDAGDEEPWYIGMASGDKYNIVVTLLDWIVEHPLIAAFEKEAGGASSFLSMQRYDRRKRREQQRETEVRCNKCDKAGTYASMPFCSRCQSRQYCSKECQVSDWKVHKHECKELAKKYAQEKVIRKAKEADEEEELARGLQDTCYDDDILTGFDFDDEKLGIRECKELAKKYAEEKVIRKVKEADEEEELAHELQDTCYDNNICAGFNFDEEKLGI